MKPTRAEMRLANQHAYARARATADATLKALKSSGPLGATYGDRVYAHLRTHNSSHPSVQNVTQHDTDNAVTNNASHSGDRVCALAGYAHARVHADTPSGTRNPDARTA